MNQDSRWAREIINMQRPDGSWGYFHTLSEPKKFPITTEQALRRLSILGFTAQDAPIQRALHYMERCLSGELETPDRREKLHDWDLFTRMMLSVWMRKFVPGCAEANRTAKQWAMVLTKAFSGGAYSHERYLSAYEKVFGKQARGGRFVDFVSFYQVSLAAGELDAETERAVLSYILRHPPGIYYICDGPLSEPPVFASKEGSRYLGALELLAAYPAAGEQLSFAVDWLLGNRNERGKWDMGSRAKDGVYFPLSDSWRKAEDREADCTSRVEKLLRALGADVSAGTK